MRSQNFISKIGSFLFGTKAMNRFGLLDQGLTVFKTFFNFTFARTNKKLFVQIGYSDNPFVFMIINKISLMTASLPRTIEGGNDAIKELYEMPNPRQTQKDFDEELLQYLEATGDAFLVLTEGIGAGLDWRIAQSYNMDIVTDKIGQIVAYKESTQSRVITHEPQNVLHIKFANIVSDSASFNRDHLFGFSPLDAAWKTVTASNEVFNAEASLFKNRGIAGFITNNSNDPMLDKDRDVIQEDMQEIMGGSNNFNKVLVSNQKVKFIQLGMSPTDLKLIESQINNLRTLCSVYGLDSSLFNDPANKTFSNRSEAQKSAFTDVYLPTAAKIDVAKSRYISRRFGVTTNIEVDKDEIEVLRAADMAPEDAGEPANE